MDLSPELPLAVLVSSLPGEPRSAIDRIAHHGFRCVQLSATQPGLRPRDLDSSARRDLLAFLRRRELAVAGIDLWIPPEHFLRPDTVTRAVDALRDAAQLAGDLGRCSISLTLPRPEANTDNGMLSDVIESITSAAQQHGVAVADHAVPLRRGADEVLGVGIDPAAWIAAGVDPAGGVTDAAHALVSARLSDLNTAGMRCPPGESGGRLDVTAYRVALSVSEYNGPVVLDSRQWVQPLAAVQRAVSAWNDSAGIV